MSIKLRIAAAAVALAMSVTIAYAVTGSAGSGVARTTSAIERIGTSLVNFYGDLPAGVPVGP